VVQNGQIVGKYNGCIYPNSVSPTNNNPTANTIMRVPNKNENGHTPASMNWIISKLNKSLTPLFTVDLII
jgi:hypothetical protein